MSDFSPDYSPDGSKITFYTYRHGKAEIYVMRADGSMQERITYDQDFQDFEPNWSNDGKSIAFVHQNREVSRIMIYHLEEKVFTQVPIQDKLCFSPSWSPDSGKLAFSCQVDNTNDIYTYDLNLDEVSRVTADEFDNTYPTWAPSGKQLAFSSVRFDNQSDIFLYDFEEKKVLRLTSTLFDELGPKWSLKTNKIVYAANMDGDSDVYSFDVEKQESVVLLNNYAEEFFPNWHPNGQSIIFSSDIEGGIDIYSKAFGSDRMKNLTKTATSNRYPYYYSGKVYFLTKRDQNSEIYALDANNSRLKRMTHSLESEGSHFSRSEQSIFFERDGLILSKSIDGHAERVITQGSSPTVSSSGKMLLFTRRVEGKSQIFLRNLITKNEAMLTSGEMDHEYPSWVSGTRFLFYMNDDQSADCWIQSIDGKEKNKLTDGEAFNFNPSLSPDRKKLLYTSTREGRGRRDLYILDLETGLKKAVLIDHSGRRDYGKWIDNSTILFESTHEFNHHIYKYSLETNTMENLTKQD